MKAGRRRIPRRRLHSLRIDIVLVALSFAASPVLLAPALLQANQPARGGPAAPFLVQILPPGAVPAAPEGPFAPTLANLGRAEGAPPRERARDELPVPAGVPPPSASAPPPYPVSRNPAPTIPRSPLSALGQAAFPGALPPPSPGPFAAVRPLPPLPQQGVAAGHGEALLFRSAGQIVPTVVVNSPDLTPGAASAVERALLSARREPAATALVERVPLDNALR